MEKLCRTILPIAMVLFIVVISGYNLYLSKLDFFKLNFAQGATLLVAIMIAYFANQINTNKRKIKENIERIALDIQKYTDNNKYYDFSENSENKIAEYLIMQRKIKNYIFILKKYSKKEGINKYIEYIENEFNTYNELVSENQNDIGYLKKSKNILINKLQNVSTKCNEMIADLYCH